MSASSVAVAVFFFFAARGVLPVETLRLDLSDGQPREVDLGVDLCFPGGEAICVGDAPSSAISSDSGTSLSPTGWFPGPTPCPGDRCACNSSRGLGRPLAAAAHDSRVVSEARNAASLSSRADGDMKLGPPLCTLVCARCEKDGRVKPLCGWAGMAELDEWLRWWT